jgi:hypothetical protein
MVCGGGFIASTVASLMMNGVCCMWQMQEEEDRRDALRKDIRVEYERQRRAEQELWEQRHNMTENWYQSDASLTDGRRRKLLADKLRLSSSSNNSRGASHHSSRATTHSAATAAEGRDGPPPQAVSSSSTTRGLVKQLESPLSRQPIKKRRVRVRSPSSVALMDCSEDEPPTMHWNAMSSLMDSALEVGEEETTSLVEVSL